MKTIISYLFSIALIASPLQGNCSHLRDCLDDRGPIAEGLSHKLCKLDFYSYSKCLVQIELIKETKNKEKQGCLKAILEVELLCLLDRALFQIEESEDALIWQTKQRDEANPPSAEYWEKNVLDTLEEMEMLKETYAEIEQLIDQHCR